MSVAKLHPLKLASIAVVCAAVAIALLALFLVQSASACACGTVITVTNTNDSGAGSLRQAIADATHGDLIDFDSELAGQTITLTSGGLVLNNNITISGPIGNITVDGNDSYQVFDVNAYVSISSVDVINANECCYGTGFGVWSGSLQLTNASVSDSHVDGYGVIAVMGGASANFNNVTLTGNTSAGHSAGFFISGDATLTNVTISGNSTAFNGGAIFASASPLGTLDLSLTNVTITNEATDGEAVLVIEGPESSVNLTITNSIIANQAVGDDCSISIFEGTYTANNNIGPSDCFMFTSGSGNINADPLLDPLALNSPGTIKTHALQAESPAIDAGTNTGCPAVDARWVVRPQNSTCDIGAYELIPGTPTPTPTNAPTATPTPTPTDTPTPTPTATPTGSPTPTATAAPTDSPTPTSAVTPTPTPTATAEPTETPSPTDIPAPTETLSPPQGPTASPAPPLVWGDLNCANGLEVEDVLANLIAFAGTFGQTSSQSTGCPAIGDTVGDNLIWGDMDCSGAITGLDLVQMIFYILDIEWPLPLPSGCPAPGATLSG